VLTTTLIYADQYTYKPSAKYTEHTLKQGEKWETDEALRLAMDDIRNAFTASQDDILKERLNTQAYERLAQVIDKNVAKIVKNSKLTQGADKAIHVVVISDLIGSSEFMHISSNVQAQRVGALGTLQTLRNYGKYFQHTGWNLETIKTK
jgi:hypothetical protein